LSIVEDSSLLGYDVSFSSRELSVVVYKCYEVHHYSFFLNPSENIFHTGSFLSWYIQTLVNSAFNTSSKGEE